MNEIITSIHRWVSEPGWRKGQILTIFFLFILAGCSPSLAEPAPTIAITQPPPPTAAPTLISTPLPSPTATPIRVPTTTPMPTPTETLAPTITQSEGRRGLIAFAMAQGNLGGIRIIQADGNSDSVTLSDHPSFDSKPSWSPDGSQIAFESNRENLDEHYYIYTMNSDGSRFTRVTTTDTWYINPDWSPDGSRIAMSSDKQEPGNADLYVLDLNIKELKRLTDDPAIDGEPSWSPDASQIVFTSERDGSFNIYTLNMDTGETTQLTQGSGVNAQPDWSPDGEKIIFASKRDVDAEIYVMDADGANPSRLTTFPGKDTHPEWSPDGNYFAFAHEEGGVRKIYVADLNGSPPELLFENLDQAIAGFPAWSVAQEAISLDPVIGPPFCMRDTDGDLKPDMPSATISTKDDFGFIVFPYDNMQDGMTFSHAWETPGELSIVGENIQSWDGGEEGIHISYSTLQHTPGVVTVKLYLEGELMQEIECEVVEP
jgi:Tol biopolymer transport system component